MARIMARVMARDVARSAASAACEKCALMISLGLTSVAGSDGVADVVAGKGGGRKRGADPVSS